MISLHDIFGFLETVFVYVYDSISSHYQGLREVLVNTWNSEENPLKSFTFDFNNFLRKYQKHRYWKSIEQNYSPLVAAFVCSLVLCLTVKILWCCLSWICSRSRSRIDRNTQLGKEAKRWFTQATLDHEASQNDMDGNTPAYEWVCFKCQQAAEKALKGAVIINRNSTKVSRSGHDLNEICQSLNDPELTGLVTNLQNIVGFSSQMRYPDMVPYPKVPRDIYSNNQAADAWDTTRLILQHVQNRYFKS